MKRRTTGEPIEPWVGILLSHVAITGSMWRGARPLDPSVPNADGDAIVALFDVQGPPPAVFRTAMSAIGRMVNELLKHATPLTRAAAALWIDRHKIELAAARESLCDAYEKDIELVRSLPPDQELIVGWEPSCAFETIFASWLLTKQPVVLHRAVDLVTAIFLALPSEPPMRKAAAQLIKDLRTLNEVAKRLGVQIKTLRRADSFQSMSVRADGLGLKRLEEALSSVVAVLAPHVSMLKARGRRSDPLKSIVVRCLRAAGLTNQDISRALGVKADAIRRQVSKANTKRTPLAPQRSRGRPGREKKVR